MSCDIHTNTPARKSSANLPTVPICFAKSFYKLYVTCFTVPICFTVLQYPCVYRFTVPICFAKSFYKLSSIYSHAPDCYTVRITGAIITHTYLLLIEL